MGTVNSGFSCQPTYQEVKKTVDIECPSTSTQTSGSQAGSYTRTFNTTEVEYVDTVYNEITHTLTNGVIREKWDNSSDPRFQQYDINTGQPIFENYCRTDKGTDEGYFYNLWEYPTSHTSTKEIVVKYTPIYQTATGSPTTRPGAATAPSVTAAVGACFKKVKVTNNFSLGKVDINVSGLPNATENSYVYWTATHKASLVFVYNNDTRTVVQVGDIINGHTVTKVANFIETKADRRQVHRVIGDNILKVNSIDGISVGDNVIGFGDTKIPTGTTVSSINSVSRTIKLSFPSGIDGLDTTNIVNIRNIIISDAEINQVPNTNYCYCEFSNAISNSKNIAFKIEGPGIHYMDYQTTTTSAGTWTSTKIDNEGGNAVFNSGETRTINVNFNGGSLVMKAEPIDDGGEYDSKWYIESFTGSLPSTGTSFQKTFNGGKGKVRIDFKIVENTGSTVVSGGTFAKNASYTGSISSASITAIAGYGIIDRAAMVGIIVSTHKDIGYEPVFNKNQPIVPDIISKLKSSFPGISEITDLREYNLEAPTVSETCDPYLTPSVIIPDNIGNADNVNKFVSNESEFKLTNIENRIDELVSGGTSIEDISKILEKENTVITNQTVSQLESTNETESNKNKQNSKKKDKKSDINLELKQDTASAQLINNILNKFSEVPDDLTDMLPELPNTIENVDGVAVISTIDGQNESSTLLVKNAYRDLPVPQDNITFIADNISLDDDKSYQEYGKNSLRETINIEVTPRYILGTPDIGSETSGETEIRILGTQLGGTTPDNDLYILAVDVDDSTGAVLSNGFDVFSSSTPKMSYVASGNLSTTQTRPSFNITGGGVNGSYSATLVSSGAGGFTVGQDFTFLGSTLGGVDGTNDLILTATAVDGSGNITTFSLFGTSADSTVYSGQTPLNTVATFSVNVEWSDTNSVSDDVYTALIQDESTVGVGYQLNDVITVLGSNLGGVNTTNDLLITVTEINPAGGISNFTISGVPETLYTSISGTNTDGVSGSGASFDILKGENSSGSPQYIVSLNNGGTLYNTAIVPSSGPTVDVVNRRNGELQLNGSDLSAFASYFKVTFTTTAPSPLSLNTVYSAYKTSANTFKVFQTPAPTTSLTSTTGAGTFVPFFFTLRFNDSPQGMTGVVFGTFSVTQNPVYYTDPQTGVQYIQEIGLESMGETYPDKSWRGNNFEVQSSFVKEYEFDLVTTSENIAKSSFSKGNPIQLAPITAKLTKTLNPTDDTILVEDTSKFLSSGYLMIPKWIKKTEIYLQLGKEGDVNELKNSREHYYYDGEEIIYYAGKTSTSFTGIKRSQFNTTYVFQTSLEPFKKNGGMVNSYQLGYSVQQYWAYSTDSSSESTSSGSSSSNVNYGS